MQRRIYLEDWQPVPVFDLETLAPGQAVDGPAIVESATTTVLLRPGDLARTTAIGWLDIASAAVDSMRAARLPNVVPVPCARRRLDH